MMENPGKHHQRLLVASHARTNPEVHHWMQPLPTHQTSQRKTLQTSSPSQSFFLPWEHISINLITGLLESNGFNAILVIIDHFPKIILLIAICDTLTSF